MIRVTYVEILDVEEDTYDITVEDNHNFFIQPKGGGDSVLVSNCHALTPAAAQALLKETEEPPEHTLWVLATTNPEKLPPTLVSRALKLPTRRATVDELTKHLVRVAKLEGHKLDKEGKAEALLRELAEMVGGAQRDAMITLGSVLGKQGGSSLLAVLKQWRANVDEAPDKAAVRFLYGVLRRRLQPTLQAVYRAEHSIRQLLYKTRYLCDNVLRLQIDQQPLFRDYAFRLWTETLTKTKFKLTAVHTRRIVQLMVALGEAEYRMNQGAHELGTMLAAAMDNFQLKGEAEDDGASVV